MTDEKPWKDMDREERAAKIAAGKAKAAAARDDAILQAPLATSVADAAPQATVGAVAAISDSGTDIAAERRRRLLGDDIDPETAALITDEELAEIEAEEAKKAKGEQKKQALADVRSIARQRARVEHQLISADVLRSEAEKERMNEPVRFKMQIPLDGSGDPSRGQAGIRVDGRLFRHGHTYTEPRHVFESIQHNVYRAWLDQFAFSTLNQNNPGNSAREVVDRVAPRLEILNAA
jgi:hypothetical protein